MIFGRLPLGEAEGAILAHGVTAGGRRLKKGHVLTGAEVDELRADGRETVLAARLEGDDLGEDQAAAAVAQVAAGSGATANAPFTGRCNLYADHAGVAVLDADAIARINAIHEGITIATLRPFETVDKGQMLATVKIIPFAMPEMLVRQAVDVAAGAVHVAPFKRHRTAILSTRLPETKESVVDKGAELMRRRIERTGGETGEVLTVEHHEVAVAEAVGTLIRDHDMLVIFSASAISDRRDVIPSGIEASGGTVAHYGMPVDPGNLMLLAELEGKPVIGAPGCARSPKENGFDWVFNRLSAGLDVTSSEIMGMGIGGLLVDTAQRGAPREDRAAGAQRMPRVAAILLAAGQSRRMGKVNKLLADVDGEPMVRHAWRAIRDSQAETAIVVTGHDPDAIHRALAGEVGEQQFVHNALHAEGLSTSLGAGLLAVPADCDAAVVCLGDMPRISPQVIDRLISAYNPVEGRAICVPTRAGKRGNPVLFDRRFFPEVLGIGGDVGARYIIGQHEDLVAEVLVEDDSIFLDVDTPKALAELK